MYIKAFIWKHSYNSNMKMTLLDMAMFMTKDECLYSCIKDVIAKFNHECLMIFMLHMNRIEIDIGILNRINIDWMIFCFGYSLVFDLTPNVHIDFKIITRLWTYLFISEFSEFLTLLVVNSITYCRYSFLFLWLNEITY